MNDISKSNKVNEDMLPGTRHATNDGGWVEVVSYEHSKRVTVVNQDGEEFVRAAYDLRLGKCPGYRQAGLVPREYQDTKAGRLLTALHNRHNQEGYRDCSVAPEWYNWENFKAWFDANYVEGYQIDKDILVQGNKVYGPDTCKFVPKSLNVAVQLGKGYSKAGNRFVAELSIDGKGKYIGTFDTEDEAHAAYVHAKERNLFRLAMSLHKKGDIDHETYLAIRRFKAAA